MRWKHSNCRGHNWLNYRIRQRFLIRHRALYRGVVYDLGAGEAPHREFFLEHADAYVAVDWGNSLYDARTDIVADLGEPLPVDSEVADTVVSLSVLEHLREPSVMLAEAARILKPGGQLVLQVPWQWWIHEAPHDYFRYTPFGLRHLLAKAGFQDVEVEALAGYFTTAILKWNYFTRRLVRGPRPLRAVITAGLWPAWCVGQLAAPWLDRLDRDWALEAYGYWVTARKPARSGAHA